MPSHINAEDRNTHLEKKLVLMHHLQDKMPQYKDMLEFFEPIITEREKYKAELASALDLHHIDDSIYFELKFKEGLPLLVKDKIEFDNKITTSYFMKLLNILKSKNSTKIVDDLIIQNENFSFEMLFSDFIHKDLPLPYDDLLVFLINETINPVLEIYAHKLKNYIKPDKGTKGFCPVCGERPVMAALQDDAGKRILICPACSSEWHFPRTQCPFCENQDQQQLSYLFIENDDRYRIELCDGCRQYLKTIDLRKVTQKVTPNITNDIDYEIENIVTLHLDIIAREKGYTNNLPDDSPSAASNFYN